MCCYDCSKESANANVKVLDNAKEDYVKCAYAKLPDRGREDYVKRANAKLLDRGREGLLEGYQCQAAGQREREDCVKCGNAKLLDRGREGGLSQACHTKLLNRGREASFKRANAKLLDRGGGAYLECADAKLLVSVVPAIANQPDDEPVQGPHARPVHETADWRRALHSVGSVYDRLGWSRRNKVEEGPECLPIVELVLQTAANPTHCSEVQYRYSDVRFTLSALFPTTFELMHKLGAQGVQRPGSTTYQHGVLFCNRIIKVTEGILADGSPNNAMLTIPQHRNSMASACFPRRGGWCVSHKATSAFQSRH